MSEDSIAFDSVLDLCQNQHRRIVLGTLAEEQRSLTVNDLTKAILKYNHQMPITEASEDVLTEIVSRYIMSTFRSWPQKDSSTMILRKNSWNRSSSLIRCSRPYLRFLMPIHRSKRR